MALVKGRFVDKTIPIQSDNDPVDSKDLARKSYVDQKAADEAAAAVAALDLSAKADLVDGKVPSSQLPGYVDDVEEYADLGSFPVEGSAGKLYVAQDTNKVYRWSGTVYIEISASPGSTDAVPEGVTNLYFTDGRAQTAVSPMFNSLAGTLAGAIANKVDKQGDEMSGDLSMGTFLVKNLGEPIEENDAARKKYVDDAIAGIDLSGKADLVHTHVAADITDFDSAAEAALADELSGKSDVGHTHVAADITDFASAAEAALADELAGKQASLGTGTTSQYLRGDLTWQTISTSAPMAQIKHVAKSGVDASADGSQEKPYLTIAAAMASITDATPSKRYVIKIAAGAYSEAVSIKANVFLVGESKESVRITGAVSMNADFNQPSGNDCRSGASMLSFLSACDFNWQTVTSPAGKLYFNEVVFGSTLAMYGHNNAIAQAQMNACIVFGNMTVSGINLGVATNNIFYGNVTLNQHPNGGMATIFAATGGSISGTLRLTTTVSDFNRRCSAFLKSCYVENLIIDGASSYVDCDLDSQGKSSTQKLNGGTLVALTPRINHDLETQMIKPLANNAHNMGDWGKQWFFNFAYVHASAGTDMYLLSAMENYDPTGDSAGRSIFINPDAYGLKTNVSGGNIELETAAVSGTGVRGKVQVKARELDMTSAKITNLADGTAPQDAVSKSQLEAAIAAIPAAQTPVGKKERIVLTATDISNGYIDCAFEAMSETMMLMTGGVVHNEGSGDDYVLSVVGGVTRITFEPDLAAILAEGDDIYLQYLRLV